MIDFEQDREGFQPHAEALSPPYHKPHQAVEDTRSFLISVEGCTVEEARVSTYADLNKIQFIRRPGHFLVRHRCSEFEVRHSDLELLEKQLKGWKRPKNLNNTKLSFVDKVRK